MLYIETWKDRNTKEAKNKLQKVKRPFNVLILKLLICGLAFCAIFCLWFDYSYPTYGSESYFDRYFSKKNKNEKLGIYFESDLILPDQFSVAEFLKTYPNFEIREKQFANIVISTEDLKTVQTFTIPDPNTEVLSRKIYVPIAKFGTLKRSISFDELRTTEIVDDNISDSELFTIFGETNVVSKLSCADVKAKVNTDDKTGFITLDCLDTSVSVLAVDDFSIFGQIIDGNRTQSFDEEFLIGNYKAKYDVWMSYGDDDKTKEAAAYIRNFFIDSVDSLANTNSVVMTGVTAMGRGTMWKIRDKGTTYPIEKVAAILQDADVAHTSNEVSFVPGCEQESHTMSFCALPESIDTLTYAGIDVVELTGNHNNDKGWQYNLDSMNLYEEKGITYVGGGKNTEDAYTVKYSELDGYKIGWIGFNELGPAYAWAADERPGAAEYQEDKLVELSKEAAANSDIAILVFQWANENYSYPTDFQETTARLAIDNGIDLVVGSQGHGTLKMEFYNGVPIYYGLGNFLFDQMFSDKVREGMILRVNTIDGKIKNLEMLPYVIEDYCQPNFVYGETAEEIVSEVVDW